jgi:CheY-like chemotaxis protein
LDASLARTQPMSILLVEDNATNQAVGLEMLDRLGYSAALAVDGLAAVQAQREALYDLILMDIQMPGMDGVEAARCIRALHSVQRPRIVALTANAAAEDRQAYLDAGMDDHLAKPFEMRDLAAVITRAFKARQTQETVPTDSAQVLDDAIRDSLKRQFGQAFLERLDETYLRTAAPLVHAAGAALAAEDGPALQRAAHALKSSSANVGAVALSRLCAELEILGKKGQLNEAVPLMTAAERSWLGVQQALQRPQTR